MQPTQKSAKNMSQNTNKLSEPVAEPAAGRSRTRFTPCRLQALSQTGAVHASRCSGTLTNRSSCLLIACALLSGACSSALPMPDNARQPRSEYLPVPYPPPAAFVETVPPSPNKQALWVDGHWAWRGGTFVWQRGGWVVVPKGTHFARWRVRYAQDGTLLFAEEAWYDNLLKPIPAPKIAVSAFSPPNELTPEAQHGF